MIEVADRFREIFGNPEKGAKDGVVFTGRQNQANNLAPLPAVAEPQRRADCEFDLQKFCETYMRNRFDLKWASFHLDMFDMICKSLDMGGQYAYAMPRGSGKSTVAEACLVWCMLYGKRRYSIVIGSTLKSGLSILNGIRTELETNQLFLEDFPEVGYIIQSTLNQAMMYKCFHLDGAPIHYSVGKQKIVLPTVEGSASSGGIIEAFSIGSTDLRGRRVALPDGTTVRPDFVIIDDPQSDTSARSVSLTYKIEEAIEKTILGLAGPSKKLTVVMPCTVIRRGDLADRYLNRDIKPEWNGTRTKMIDSFPTNMDLWKEYHAVRMASFKDGTYGIEGLDFYRKNRVEMDAGSQVTWEDRFTPPMEISAIQHAMNKYLSNPSAFASEGQNEPLEDIIDDVSTLSITVNKLSERLIESNTFVVPAVTQMITTGIDVQGKILYFLTVAWSEDFGGVIVDWGTFPDQSADFWNTRNPPIPLESIGRLAPNPLVFEGLNRLLSTSLSRAFFLDNGTDNPTVSMKPERILIDANYTVTSDAVHAFCQANSSICHPTYGRGIPASGLPMEEWAKRQGERKGTGWIIRPNTAMSNRGRHILIDTNYWKDRLAERLSMPLGSTNGILFRNAGQDKLQFLMQQLSAEKAIPTFGRGRWVNQWQTLAHDNENHWLDCLIGSAVAASISGLKLHVVTKDERAAPTPLVPRKISDVSRFKKSR